MDEDAVRAQELARELQDLDAKQREVEERLRGGRPPMLLRRRHTLPGPGLGPGPGPAPRGVSSSGQFLPTRSFQRPPGLFQRYWDGAGARAGNHAPAHAQAQAQEAGENGEEPDSASKRRRLQSLVALPGGDADSRQSVPRDAADERNGSGGRTPPEGRDAPGGTTDEAVPPRPVAASDATTRKRNRKIFGALLLGTLERFRDEDEKLQDSDAFTRRSLMLRRAEQKAEEEREALRLQQRERHAEERRQDMTLRARLAAQAEEKDAQLLMIKWKQHHKALTTFFRTRSNPPIYFRPVGRPPGVDSLEEAQREAYKEWEQMRAEELQAHAEENLKRHLQSVPAHPSLPGRSSNPGPAQHERDGTQAWGPNSAGAGEERDAGEAQAVPTRAEGGRRGKEGTGAQEGAVSALGATGSDSDDAELSGDSPGASPRQGRSPEKAQGQGDGLLERAGGTSMGAG